MFACLQILAQDHRSKSKLSVSFPDKAWWVEVDSPGFSAKANGTKPDGRRYLFANNPRSGVILSIMLEQSSKADMSTCPDYLQQRLHSVSKLGFVATNAKTSEINSMPVLEYLIPKDQDTAIQQKNIVACVARDDVYIDIHLSKAHFQPADEATLLDVLSHVRIAGESTAAAVSTPAP